ncbi:hypothetical protein D9M71_689520 [compost metagenome]
MFRGDVQVMRNFIGEEHGSQQGPRDDAICKVVGGDDHDHRHHHHNIRGERVLFEVADGAPTKGTD